MAANYDMAKDDFTEVEKRKAAYALNMCMVSVSQIIDYDDIYILEQEYEAILNNLNLEQMPKDEALLSILNRLLDVITFFRIQEGDKKMLEKEYQDKMRNSIWSAVPNIGMIVASANPIAIGTALVSQVGIGYMNYRKKKANVKREREKEMWKLQRNAMEQFNSLRRELFDTAWRLADTYHFPDEWRLTERQIHQYNEILMDTDIIRKYERMDAIKGKFEAYPAFWYYFGNTANLISQDAENESIRSEYQNLAKAHFEQYWNAGQYKILREDQIAATCALEYIELLDYTKEDESNKERIEDLIKEALSMSQDENDTMQLCVMAYFKIDEAHNAESLLRRLVNEDYNKIINGQLLSMLYARSYLKNQSEKIHAQYSLLQTRMPYGSLYPLPDKERFGDEGSVEEEFLSVQKESFARGCKTVIDDFCIKYLCRFGEIVPDTKPEKEGTSYGRQLFIRRVNRMKAFLRKDDARLPEWYALNLQEINLAGSIADILDEMTEAISYLDLLYDEEDIREFISVVREQIQATHSIIDARQRAFYEGEMSYDDYQELVDVFKGFVGKFVLSLQQRSQYKLDTVKDMAELSSLIAQIQGFCGREGLPDIDLYYEKFEGIGDEEDRKWIDISWFGDDAAQMEVVRNVRSRMEKAFKDHDGDIFRYRNYGRTKIHIKGSAGYKHYFEVGKEHRRLQYVMRDVCVIVADSKCKNVDLFFTPVGIMVKKVHYKRYPLSWVVNYKDVSRSEDVEYGLVIGDIVYKNPGIDMDILWALIDEFARLQ